MDVKLNLLERLVLLQMLPKEGSYVMLKVIRDIQQNVGVKDEEFKEFEIKQEGEQVKWNSLKGKVEKDFKFGEKAFDLIQETLKKLNKDSKITGDMFSLCEKFGLDE